MFYKNCKHFQDLHTTLGISPQKSDSYLEKYVIFAPRFEERTFKILLLSLCSSTQRLLVTPSSHVTMHGCYNDRHVKILVDEAVHIHS